MGNNGSSENSLESVVLDVKESQGLGLDYPVFNYDGGSDCFNRYAQMEYVSDSGHKFDVFVFESNDSFDNKSCLGDAIRFTLNNLTGFYGAYDTIGEMVAVYTTGKRVVKFNDVSFDEIYVDDLRGLRYNFFWIYDSRYILHVSGDPSQVISEDDVFDTAASISYYLLTSDNLILSDDDFQNASEVNQSFCQVGSFGFPLYSSVVPLNHFFSDDGVLSIEILNDIGADVVINSISCRGESCNDGWSGEVFLAEGDSVLIEVDDFADSGVSGDCYRLTTTIGFTASNGLPLLSSGMIVGVY